MTDKVFSHGKWITVKTVEVPGVPTTRKQPEGPRFTMFPKIWREQLRKVKARGTTYEVAMVILDKTRFAEWVTLPNAGLAKLGINRHAKYDAIKKVEGRRIDHGGGARPLLPSDQSPIHRPTLCCLTRPCSVA
jgi:hypothetical protein